jgi:endonuclease/exonuclease/phosphatase family metal-dependent hydrolase
MTAKGFTDTEWAKIRTTLDSDPGKFGLPERIYGSVVLASFNIRKLGAVQNRSDETWRFLAHICSRFDLLAVQEIMGDLSGVRRLVADLGSAFSVIGSDTTGAFPGDPGLSERLGFMYRSSVIERGPIVSDVTYDRSKLLETLARNKEELEAAVAPHAAYFQKLKAWLANDEQGPAPAKPMVKLPTFLTFIRQPFCVSFKIVGHPGTKPYELMVINAHLYYGDFMSDRRQEFSALMEWIMARVGQNDKNYYPNFVLMGDLNLDFNSPQTDRARIEKHIKSFNDSLSGVNVNFPFLGIHPGQREVFRTNARQTETFDQIGLFSRDERLPTVADNQTMGENPRGPDFGVFNFGELFSEALHQKKFSELSKKEQRALYKRFEHNVSDHMPIWLRIPLPDPEKN